MSKVKGDEAADRFDAWANSQSLSYFREIANSNRTQLVRASVMEAVRIDRPALRQNARIKQALLDLENRLRDEGVLIGQPVIAEALPPDEGMLPQRPRSTIAKNIDAERLKRLEKEVAAKDAELVALRPLRYEVQDLKEQIRNAHEKLQRFKAMESVLRESGRLPR
ncbi:hypothetical protein [Rhodoferax mekongensis]|uniref:Uncharacterized protein n=1 Tax=Rhodoferax mekongensis TaxID=3068341 RepID=A0ABZ0AU03_9BURK|nr:hypothetical protein [Rhodoferax sp. TBRC 17307]WNO03172.1 hypothetical protein RAN89_09455 [Rhodoferax sp. TBRC 17307]